MKPRAGDLSFAEFQAAFQSAVLRGDDAILSLIPDGAREKKAKLLGVYRDGYVLRLVDVLGADHPILRAYLGEDAFDAMARAYVAVHPSDQPNARWFSRHAPEFLAREAPYRDRPEVAELAMLEKTLGDAFDGVDAPTIAVADLAAIPPEDWGDLAFTPHPTAARLDLKTNATAIWSAVKDETKPPKVRRHDPPEKVLVWRGETTPMFRTLPVEEAMMWDEAAKGVRFGVLCEMLATYDDPDGAPARAAQHLAGWLASGLIARTALLKPTRRKRSASPKVA